MLRVGIVTGEPSGDELGADLIASLKTKHPDLIVEGIGGEKLIAQGCRSLFDMERLSVMGLFEILGRYFELLKIQKSIKQYFINNPPDVFIGIDSPDFNLSIEKALKNKGIKTIHYVSPSVWAWREGRLKTIKKSVDLMLTLFPFEERYYREHNIPVKFVGHPLACQIPLEINKHEIRDKLSLNQSDPIIAILPGSRTGEITRLTRPFLEACQKCLDSRPDLKLIVGLRDKRAQDLFLSIKKQYFPELEVTVFTGKTREVLMASDCVLLSSGTATLEAMLCKKPMVVAYKANVFTYWIIKSMLKVPYVSLPNLIANEYIVPEYLQHRCTADNLAHELLGYINNPEKSEKLTNNFIELHKTLQHDNISVASDTVNRLLIQNAD